MWSPARVIFIELQSRYIVNEEAADFRLPPFALAERYASLRLAAFSFAFTASSYSCSQSKLSGLLGLFVGSSSLSLFSSQLSFSSLSFFKRLVATISLD